jgi:hypothetical protein
MQMRRLLLGFVMSLVLPFAVAHASSNPIPGVGIIVKRNPCCSSARIVIPGGFFGPGSVPFDQAVSLEGRCSHNSGGSEDNCAGSPDSRLDYSTDNNAGPFEVSMAATTMYSTTPIEVSINGVLAFFDVFVELSGPGPASDDAIPGTMTLAPGASLDPGTSAPVAGLSLDITYKITFHDHTTGDPAGAFLTGDLEAILKSLGLLVPAARVANGTPTGQIVMGSDGVTSVLFTVASANDELVIQMLSLYQQEPVATQPATWGAVKGMYR